MLPVLLPVPRHLPVARRVTCWGWLVQNSESVGPGTASDDDSVTGGAVGEGGGAGEGGGGRALMGPEGFRTAFGEMLIPALRKFDPDIIFISAGFDGCMTDPLGGNMGLHEEDFKWLTQQITGVAHAEGAACKGGWWGFCANGRGRGGGGGSPLCGLLSLC